MKTPRMDRSALHSARANRRRPRIIAVSAIIMASALAMTACAPSEIEPTPTPTATPTVAPVQYPPQPAFAASEADLPPEDIATAVSTTASITSSYSATGRALNTNGLLNVSQGGYTSMNNLNWFTAQAAQMSSMGIKEVRIDHVFDDPFYKVVSKDAAGVVSYDFSRLDQVLLPLVAHDITPFITLSYMPMALAESAYAPPKSMDAWAALVAAFVGHYRDLGHTGWEYEVWNELDTNHWLGDQDAYNALYVASANAVRSVDGTAKIGGPAASGLDSLGDWSENFINFLGANPTVPIDFFTTHSYRSNDWESIPQARAWLKDAGLENLPIYITEWNNDSFMDRGAGAGSDTNSSIDGSSYLARRLYLASQSGGAKFFYFSPVEGFNYHIPYNGDLGLVTADGHRKAGGNVFEMYSELDPTLQPATVVGAGSETHDVFGMVTKDADEKTNTALLWNHTENDVEMTLQLDDLPYAKTNFTTTVSMVTALRGNGFSDTSTEVAPKYPSPNENAPVVEDSVMKAAKSLTKTITIPAHGVVNVALAPTKEKETGDLPISAEPAAINLAAAAAGAITTASSSVEKVAEGWSVSSLSDGRRHSIEPAKFNIKGWSSTPRKTAAATETVRVDLGGIAPVDTMVMWPRDSQLSNGKGFPSTFTIQGSVDDVTWAPLYTGTAYNNGLPVDGPQTFSFPVGEYRYLKVEATELTSTSLTTKPEFSFQLAELEVYRLGIVNGGFETGALEGWEPTGDASVQSDVVRSGTKGLLLKGKDAGISTLLTGLLPSTTYTVGAHVWRGKGAEDVSLAISEYGGETSSAAITSDQWESVWVTFTTGEQHTSAEIALSVGDGGGSVWADDLLITQKMG